MAKLCKHLTGYEMPLIPVPSRGLRQEVSHNWMWGIQPSLLHSSLNPPTSDQEGRYGLLTRIPTDGQGLEIQNKVCVEKPLPLRVI